MRQEALDQGERDALSDEEVVRRVRAGEIDLFEILMRRYNQRVYRLARAVLRRDSEAEDLAQEAWVRAYEHLDQFAGRAAFSTWLSRIALNEAWARLRRSKRFETIEPDAGTGSSAADGASASPDPEEEAMRNEAQSFVEAAIEKLPEIYRTVVVLRHVEELSTAETAELLQLSEETVKTRLHRARSALQQELLAETSAGAKAAFPFLGERCDRLVEAVLERIGQNAR